MLGRELRNVSQRHTTSRNLALPALTADEIVFLHPGPMEEFTAAVNLLDAD
jgi:hypothetical protein